MPERDLNNLTPEERQRLTEAEAYALSLLSRRMREDRRTPRRHQLVALAVLGGLIALAMFISFIVLAFRG